MHELSIAMSIVDIAEKEVKKHGASKVDEIEILIGSLAGVELDALDFVWQAAIQDTVLADAQKHIHYLKAKAKCLECETTFNLEQAYDNCPKCGSYLKELLQGKELKVKRLILEK